MKEKNITVIVALVISIVALALSIVSICIASPHIKQLGFDYQGILVSALSLLVTVLIGWQILNVIDLDKRVDKKIKEKEDELNTRISILIELSEKKTNTIQNFLSSKISNAITDIYRINANLAFKDKKYGLYVFYMVESIHETYQSGDKSLAFLDATHLTDALLSKLEGTSIELYESEKKFILKSLEEIKEEKIIPSLEGIIKEKIATIKDPINFNI